MSAPATKVRPAQAITTARVPASASAFASVSLRPTRTECRKALTGGLSIVMTATSPSLRMSTTPI
jgi:hypothetical protein